MGIVQGIVLAGLVAMASAAPGAQNLPPQGQQMNRPNNPQGQPGRGRGQGQGQSQGLPAVGQGVPVQQMQAMFDAYALVQAQRVLELNDEQYQRFFTRMNHLQDLRRQHMQQRTRMLNELRRLWRSGDTNDGTLAEQTRALDDLESKFEGDLRASRQAIDEALTPRQRAGFRFFEEEMDRQKLDFLTKSRQGVGRGGGQGGGR